MNIISTIALLGTAQGLFLTVALFAWRKGNRRANIILATLFAMMSLAMWNTYLNLSGLYHTWTFTIRVYDAMRLLNGPLIYCYVREMVVRPLHRRDLLHFAPTLVYVVWLIPFFLSPDAEKIRFLEQTLEGNSQEYIVFAAVRPWVALVYYVISMRLLSEYSRRIQERFASLEVVGLQWLWNIVLGLTAMSAMVAIASLGTLFGHVRPSQINTVMAMFAVLWIYGLAYFALQKTMDYSSELRQLLAEPLDIPDSTPFFLLPGGEPILPLSVGIEQKRIAGNQVNTQSAQHYLPTASQEDLAPETLQVLANHLIRFMDEHKPYLDNQLTLQKLATMTEIPAYRISDILNKHLGLNFFDFVNRARVEEWARLVENTPASLTIQELAFQVGFNSKSSFNTAFKKHTGQTPSEYRTSLRSA